MVFLQSGDAPGLVGEAGSRAGRESDPALVLPSAPGCQPVPSVGHLGPVGRDIGFDAGRFHRGQVGAMFFLWLGLSVRSNPREVVGMIALLERRRQQLDNSASDYVRYIPFCHAQTAGAIDLVSSWWQEVSVEIAVSILPSLLARSV